MIAIPLSNSNSEISEKVQKSLIKRAYSSFSEPLIVDTILSLTSDKEGGEGLAASANRHFIFFWI